MEIAVVDLKGGAPDEETTVYAAPSSPRKRTLPADMTEEPASR